MTWLGGYIRASRTDPSCRLLFRQSTLLRLLMEDFGRPRPCEGTPLLPEHWGIPNGA
jgi:hypothetical protein